MLGHQEIQLIREKIVTSKSLRKVRRTEKLGQDRLMRLLIKQGRCNEMRRRNMDTHQPSKAQASSRTNKYGKEYVNHHIPGHNTNIWVREKTKITKVGRRKWSQAERVSRIRGNRWARRITTWKAYERKIHRGRPARRWIEEVNDYWKGSVWQRIAHDRQIWKQHAEAFTQSLDTMNAQR